jgi:pimeloyl-ACP methyl ester carboxylesterase
LSLKLSRRSSLKSLAALPVAASLASTAAATKPGQRFDFVLVHGTWLGAWIWKEVVPLLFAAGHRAYAPTLTGTGERAHLIGPDVGLETHIQDIAALIDSHELDRVVLVGHSFSGIAVTGVADRRRDRIAHLCFFDAIVPTPGRMSGVVRDPQTGAYPDYFQKRIAGFKDGYKMDFFADYPIQMLANDDEPEVQALAYKHVTHHPMRGWTDGLVLQNGCWAGLSRSLIICAGQKYQPSSDAMLGPAKADSDFRIERLPISRLGMLSKPKLVADALIKLAVGKGRH